MVRLLPFEHEKALAGERDFAGPGDVWAALLGPAVLMNGGRMKNGAGIAKRRGGKRATLSLRLMASGLACLAGWAAAINVNGSNVLFYLERFALDGDGRYLLASAVSLLALNTMRALLLYLGWFYIGNSLNYIRRGKRLSWLVPIIAIPACYLLVSRYPDGFSLHFGIPALFSVITVLVMHLSTREIKGWFARSLVLSLLVFSFQWLDLAPSLSRWGFGGGELSSAVKTLAVIEEWDWVMDALSLGLFFTAFSGGMAAASLLVAANIRNAQFRKIRERDIQISTLREETLRVRGYREMQQLVHDLRRPLTTILGLADVMAETLPAGIELDHARRIVATGANMNHMIEELLKEDARQMTTVANLLDYVGNQISAFDWRRFVRMEADEEISACEIRINLIRFSRALVNILDNSHIAVKGRSSPEIDLSVKMEEGRLLFIITDNGSGFAEKNPTPTSFSGVSSWGSTGIGLAFVDEVVKNHGGKTRISNRHPRGAVVAIALPLIQASCDEGRV